MTKKVPEWIPVAEIIKPKGLSGEFKVKVYNPDSEAFAVGREIRIFKETDPFISVKDTITQFVWDGLHESASYGFALMTLESSWGREDIQKIQGAEILISEEDLPDLDQGEAFLKDVLGMDVVDHNNGEVIGQVESFYETPAHVVLSIKEIQTGRIGELPWVTEKTVVRVESNDNRIVICGAIFWLGD